MYELCRNSKIGHVVYNELLKKAALL